MVAVDSLTAGIITAVLVIAIEVATFAVAVKYAKHAIWRAVFIALLIIPILMYGVKDGITLR